MDEPGDDIVQRLDGREVFRNEWLVLREDDVRFPDGHTGRYAVVDKDDFVVVLAHEVVDGAPGFWLVQEYRYPVQRRVWGFPQGGWPDGRSGTPAELAAAELREETVCRATDWTHLGRLDAAHGFCSQGYDVFLAGGLTRGPARREATESDMVARWHAVTDVRTMIRDGALRDAHSVAALALYDLHADPHDGLSDGPLADRT